MKNLSTLSLTELFDLHRVAFAVYRQSMLDAGVHLVTPGKPTGPALQSPDSLSLNMAQAGADWRAVSLEITDRRRAMGYHDGCRWTVEEFRASVAA